MTDAQITTLIQSSLETLMWIVLPMLAIFIVFIVTFPWLLRVLVTFTANILGDFTPFIK